MLWGIEVEQAPRADVAKGPLALQPQLDVFALLSQRRGAAVPLLVGGVVVRIGVHEAPAFKVDEGETAVGGDIVCGHQHLDLGAQLAERILAFAAGAKRAVTDGTQNVEA